MSARLILQPESITQMPSCFCICIARPTHFGLLLSQSHEPGNAPANCGGYRPRTSSMHGGILTPSSSEKLLFALRSESALLGIRRLNKAPESMARKPAPKLANDSRLMLHRRPGRIEATTASPTRALLLQSCKVNQSSSLQLPSSLDTLPSRFVSVPDPKQSRTLH